jgi:DNA-binding XRE family transcriptional regulator
MFPDRKVCSFGLMKPNEWVGGRIRQQRNYLNYTQEYLAQQIGISPGTLSKIESGQ